MVVLANGPVCPDFSSASCPCSIPLTLSNSISFPLEKEKVDALLSEDDLTLALGNDLELDLGVLFKEEEDALFLFNNDLLKEA